MMKTSPNNISWRDGTPVSGLYDDVYYSMDGGLAESRFTFLDGTHVVAQFTSNEHTVIGETGFGTGLNFLATWYAWRMSGSKGRFTFISCEASPMTSEELAFAHAAFPELSDLSEQLCRSWPPPAAAFHPRDFEDGRVSLILLFGDAADTLAKLNAQIDIWYLDGFAPAKNPQMWSDVLFGQIARLSKPNAKLATFTAAGAVRRGLIEHGFSMQKAPGYGRKRERLVGVFTPETMNTLKPAGTKLWASTPPVKNETSQPKRIAIIGAGIGGAMTAYALKKRGFSPTLFQEEKPINDTTSLPNAIIAPRLFHKAQLEQPFFDAAFALAVHHPMYQHAFGHDLGIEFIATTPQEKQRLENVAHTYGWPPEWLQENDKGLYLPKAGTLDAQSVLKRLLSECAIENTTITHIERRTDTWLLYRQDSGEPVFEADVVVLAAGVGASAILDRSHLSIKLRQQHPELRPTAGQIEFVSADKLNHLQSAACVYGGYATAAMPTENGHAMRTIGSTYTRLDEVPNTRLQPSAKNRARVLDEFNQSTNSHIANDDVSQSWIGLRAAVSDHLPFAGPIPKWDDLLDVCQSLSVDAKKPLSRPVTLHDGLYLLAGLGSKGFQYAPLLSDYIAAMIAGDPYPLPNDMIERFHPARGVVRELIRGGRK